MNLLYSILYELHTLVKEEASRGRLGHASKEGHLFEDKVFEKLKEFEPQISKIEVRNILELPTFSGIKNHQFDCTFVFDGIQYTVECKRQTSGASKNQIYYFNSTITDHILGIKADGLSNQIRGIFLSTEDFGENSMIYGITNAIQVITPKFPPLGAILTQVKNDSDLAKMINQTINHSPKRSPFYETISRFEHSPAQIYQEYAAILSLWQNDM